MAQATEPWQVELSEHATKREWPRVRELGIFYKNCMNAYKPDTFAHNHFLERYQFAKDLYAQREK